MMFYPAINLLVAVFCLTAVYITAEAACPEQSCIRGLPGRDGRDGKDGAVGPPGRDGRDAIIGLNGIVGPPGPPGLPGTLNDTERQELKNDILDMLRNEFSALLQCEARVHTSCKELYQCNPATPSGYYNISTPQGVKRVYCEMGTTNCGNITGGWMRVANIDMTNENNTCPENLTYTVPSSVRMCRSSHTTAGCTSVTFPAHMIPYTKVCGRAHGYGYTTPDAFRASETSGQTIEGYYVDGLSVTHGRPRSHVWTFAAGVSKTFNHPKSNCPCAAPYPGAAAPSFVGEDYFCESGSNGTIYQAQWFLRDPLWDSQGCATGSTCCDRGGPWFSTEVNEETRDDIEVRWCSSYDNEDIGVDQLEIYIN